MPGIKGAEWHHEGQTFGDWIVVSFSHIRFKYDYWNCVCVCGAERAVMGKNLRSGFSAGCGCRRGEKIGNKLRTHGLTRTKEYRAWQSMMQRCYNPKFSYFDDYGGRGITVCERWKMSFEDFLSDMGSAPSDSHSIDRIDTNGDYEIGNCRWATPKEQARNMRRTTMITFNGETRALTEWEEILGFKKDVIRSRLRYGWTIEEALTRPTRMSTNNYNIKT